MKSKADQLFLELCLLRLRYSQAEIEEVAQARGVPNNPEMRSILEALKNMHVSTLEKRSIDRPIKGKKRARLDPLDFSKAISLFVQRISDGQILRQPEELEKFARSLGLKEVVAERPACAQSIRRVLESMTQPQAMQRLRSVDGEFESTSSPYVSLAKTLLRR